MNSFDHLTIVSLAEITSTNTHAKNHLTAFQGHLPCFLLAEKQSRGKGRDDRSWDSPYGGFYGTLVHELPHPPLLSYGLLSLLAGLGVLDTLSEMAPQQHFDLKWPNDILCRGLKIAGILVENQIKGQQWLSLWGIGINLDRRNSPFVGALSQTAVALSELGVVPPSPIELALRLNARFHHWLDIWSCGRINVIQNALDSASHSFFQQHITFHDHGEICRGVFERIDKQGALHLLLENGERRVCYTGEIE